MTVEKIKPVNIRIKNFQSIEDIDIEVNGFTCITGPTNSGKSAILRAVSSAILNDPVVGMVRKGSNFCSVEMSSEAGWGFEWQKGESGKGISRCIIGTKTLDKIGQKQLQEVVDMGFGSIKLGNKEVQPWFASQFFPIFLLGETGGTVTDFISEVSRLTVVQDSITLASRGKRQENELAKIANELSVDLRNKLSRVSDFSLLEKLETELYLQRKSILEYEAKIAVGEILHTKIQNSQICIRILEKVDDVKTPDDNVGTALNNCHLMSAAWKKLSGAANRVIAVRPIAQVKVPESPQEVFDIYLSAKKLEKITRERSIVSLLDPVKNVMAPSITSIVEAYGKYSDAKQLLTKIDRIQQSVKELDAIPLPPESSININILLGLHKIKSTIESRAIEVGLAKKAKMEAEKELEIVKAEIDKLPTCPSCGRLSNENEHKHEFELIIS